MDSLRIENGSVENGTVETVLALVGLRRGPGCRVSRWEGPFFQSDNSNCQIG
jgi:hypothetical protein